MLSQDSDRSRQNLKKVIFGIQRAKLRQIFTRPSKTMDSESSVVHEVGASDAPELSAKTAMVASKDAEPSSSDFSILSESRDVESTGAFILGSLTSGGGTHIKTSSASDIQPLSPAEPSPVRIVLSPKWGLTSCHKSMHTSPQRRSDK